MKKARLPIGEPRLLDSPDPERSTGFKKTFTVELITPIYGGGVVAGHPDEAMPIRASAIRGQLRFWWRLLNRAKYGRDSQTLFQAEREIWGGLSSDDLGVESRVIVTVKSLLPHQAKPCAKYRREEGRLKGPDWSEHGLPGYVLFPGQGELQTNRTDFKPGKEPAGVILPPMKFHLSLGIRFRKGDNVGSLERLWEQQVFPTFRWWASFGGIGARTRRGMGSIKVKEFEPINDKDAESVGCRLISRDSHHEAMSAWKETVGQLHTFRQGVPVARNPGGSGIPSRSNWPEADSIRDIIGCHYQSATKTHTPKNAARLAFPRASFGLPVITHFKDGPGKHAREEELPKLDPIETSLVPLLDGKAQDRMSSPLILKAMWNGKDYTPIALLLPHEHLTGMGLQLQLGPTKPLVDFPPGRWWCDEAQNRMTRDKKTNPLKDRTGDVLQDFLDHFGGGDA